MGHKVNPIGIRLGIVKDHTAKWYAPAKNYADFLLADLHSRALIKKEFYAAGVSKIDIERLAKDVHISIGVARPGQIIGRNGEAIKKVSKQVSEIMGIPTRLTVNEIRKPELDANLVAESIAQQLERRVMFRRAMKRAVTTAMRLGAKGIKIIVSGRLGGAEIARSELYREGRVPLHTFRADIDYGTAEAKTTYGIIGVKVWIFKGEVLGKNEISTEIEEKPAVSDHKKPRSDTRGRKPDSKNKA